MRSESNRWATVLGIPLMLGWFAWASVRHILTPFVLMAVGVRGLMSGRIRQAFSEAPTLTDEIGGVVIAVILIVLSQAFF